MWNVKKLFVAGILTCAFALSPRSAETVANESKTAELVRAVRESENWIHQIESLYIRIESKWTRTPAGIAARCAEPKELCSDVDLEPNRLPKLKPSAKGILEYAIDEARVRFLNQETDCWRQLKVWDGKQLIAHEEYFSDNQEHYYLNWTPQGSFDELIAFQTSWPISQPHSFWWDRKDVDELLSYYGRPADFGAAGRSDYRGVDCFILEFYPRDVRGILVGQSHQCDSGMEDRQQYGLIGEARGLADQSYRWYVGTKDHRLYGLVWFVSKKPHVEHWMSDYRQVSPGCWFPMTQGYELYGRTDDGEHYLETRRDLKILEVRINEKLPDELFQIELKKGVKVIDNRSGRAVTYTYRPDPPELVGKPLPEFQGIETDFEPGQAKDRSILVCFWDIDQRPSRHCIRQLAKQAEQLKQKGVTIVAVQASKLDEKKLNEWVKKYEIPFPVGMIQGDVEKNRFTWGVRSLPWLILTDKQHLVTAEGFTPPELDEKLSSNSKN